MDEVERVKKQIRPPNLDAWNKQMYTVRVFDELIYDTDANLTNVLIGRTGRSGASISPGHSANTQICASPRTWCNAIVVSLKS